MNVTCNIVTSEITVPKLSKSYNDSKHLNNWFGPKWMCSLTVNWVKMKNKNGISPSSLGSLYFILCHIVSNVLSFQVLAKILNFILVEYAWNLGYRSWCYVCSFFVPYYSPGEGQVVGFKPWTQIGLADFAGWMPFLQSNLI